MEQRTILTDNEKLALKMAGDTTSRIMTLDGKTAEDVIEERNIKNFNEQVDQYVEKFNEHSTKLEEYSKNLSENVDKIEIMPIYNNMLIKEFAENPFQRIVKDSSSGLILDLGGQRPQYKNTDNGQIEEEEQFIHVGVIQEVGPDCKYCKPSDTVFYTKPSAVPVPFYKQGLVLVNENRIMAIVNEGLTERMNNIKKV